MPDKTMLQSGRGAGTCRAGLPWLLAFAVLAMLGCDETPTLPPKPATPAIVMPASSAAAPAATQPAAPAPPAAAVAMEKSAPAAVTTPENGDPTPGADREKAVRGSGVQGRKYGGGVITEPVRQYFRLQQAAVFEIQIPSAVDLFKAEHNNRYPKDWAEFKREILDPASINLPELPPGERYVYDGKTGELMVERPAPPETP